MARRAYSRASPPAPDLRVAAPHLSGVGRGLAALGAGE